MKQIQEVLDSDVGKEVKIIRLWCIVQLNYRTDKGDAAWRAMETLTDRDTVKAISFLTGFAMGAGLKPDHFVERLEELLNRNVFA